MFKDIFKNYIYPIATLSGSIIGVGFLSLPYIGARVGFVPMFFCFVVLVVFILFIHLIFTDICLATPDFKRWPGFVEFYFGKWAKRLLLIPMILGIMAVMLVYLLIGSQFLLAVFGGFLGGTALAYALLYFIVAAAAIFFGIKIVAKFEFWALILLLASIGLIFLKGFSHFHIGNIVMVPSSGSLDWRTAFLPFGAIMFSLWGTGLIPETEEMVRGRKKSLKKIVIIGTLIPACIYLVFIFLILGISGSGTSESALIGLKSFLGTKVVSVALLMGFITTFTAFLAQGLLLKKILMYDLKVKHFPAWVFTCFPPLILFLLGFHSFIYLISFVGGVLLSLEGILILLIYKKLGGKKIITYLLSIIFVLAILYSLFFA